jgi:hypothetical protein
MVDVWWRNTITSCTECLCSHFIGNVNAYLVTVLLPSEVTSSTSHVTGRQRHACLLEVHFHLYTKELVLPSRIKESHFLLTWRNDYVAIGPSAKVLLLDMPLKMGPKSCPETSVNDYHSTLRYAPEEHRSHQHRGGSLKSRRSGFVFPPQCYLVLPCPSR